MNGRYDYIGEGVAVVFTALQPDEIFKIISLVLTIVSILVSLGFTLYKWYKEAKKDGVISKDEVKVAVEETKKAVEEVKNKVKENKKDKEE